MPARLFPRAPRATRPQTSVESLEARTLLAVVGPLKDISPAGDSRAGDFFTVGPTVFFSADDGAHGVELWKTDGTEAGTVLVKDINPGFAYFDPRPLVQANGVLYFVANDGTHGPELWRSDGTEAGTAMVKDVRPGSSGALDNSPVAAAVGGTVFFGADDGTHGRELWKTDGTEAGTVMVRDMEVGPSFGGAWRVAAVGGAALFDAGPAGRERLWRTDGTPEGTVMIGPDDVGSKPYGLTPAGGRVFFSTDEQLWVTDGTAAGTRAVTSKLKHGAGGITPTGDGGAVYFFAEAAGRRGRWLWRSDGTEAGTVPLKALDHIGTPILATLGNTVYFTDNGGIDRTLPEFDHDVRVLWKSDGTRKGTRPVDIPKAQWIGNFAAVGGRMYFDTRHRNARTLWETAESLRGAAAVHVTDMTTGGSDNDPGPVVAAVGGGRAVFAGGDAQRGWELWSLAPDPTTGDPVSPDLVVSVDGLRARRPHAGGRAVVSLRVSNAGTAPVEGTAAVRVWLTAGDGDAEMPNTAALPLRLGPGKSRRFNVPVTLPATLPPRPHVIGWPADYHVAAHVDPDNRIAESFEENNTGATERPVKVYPLVDPGLRSIGGSRVLGLTRGQDAGVRATVVNRGVQTARGRVAVRATLEGPGMSTVAVGLVEQDVTIRAGGALSLTVPVVLPADLPAGTYRLRLRLLPDPAWGDEDVWDNEPSVDVTVS